METAIVTGGGRGIGAAIVKRLAHTGRQVYALDLAHPELDPREEGIIRERIDISKPDLVEALVNRVRHQQGRIDVLVNNAGVRVTGDVIETSIDEWIVKGANWQQPGAEQWFRKAQRRQQQEQIVLGDAEFKMLT